MCQGYYRHEEGYTPQWDGMADHKGTIVHPRIWPEDLDYKGKTVLVIGSRATAATVPAMAGEAKHMTELQLYPTWFRIGRNGIQIADEPRELGIEEEWVHEIAQKKIRYEQAILTRRSMEEPETVKEELLSGARNNLPPDYDVETHFAPKYRPWRQRIAFIPEGDMFEGIKAGMARDPRPCQCLSRFLAPKSIRHERRANPDPLRADAHRAFRRADRGRRYLRRRRRLSPDAPEPGNELCRPGGAREFRRDVADA
jgi:cation diffusion facilitator CzcD-associated flavoprotein CzcO